jgi:DNA invertase Pin-like site-specific DNA recombinase
VNYHALCLELTNRLAEHVPPDDPLLQHASRILAARSSRPFQRGAANPAAVMTPEDVRELRREHASGMSYSRLAYRYGISVRNVGRICNREYWAWVQ